MDTTWRGPCGADPAFQATMLVALTGYAAPEDIYKSSEAGFHDATVVD
jgi:hypothetical protein